MAAASGTAGRAAAEVLRAAAEVVYVRRCTQTHSEYEKHPKAGTHHVFVMLYAVSERQSPQAWYDQKFWIPKQSGRDCLDKSSDESLYMQMHANIEIESTY